MLPVSSYETPQTHIIECIRLGPEHAVSRVAATKKEDEKLKSRVVLLHGAEMSFNYTHWKLKHCLGFADSYNQTLSLGIQSGVHSGGGMTRLKLQVHTNRKADDTNESLNLRVKTHVGRR